MPGRDYILGKCCVAPCFPCRPKPFMLAVAQRMKSAALWTRRRRVQLPPADPKTQARGVRLDGLKPPQSQCGDREFDSHTPCQNFLSPWDCSLDGIKRCTVDAENEV